MVGEQVQDGRGLGLDSWRKRSEWLGARPGWFGVRPGQLGARPGQLENKSRLGARPGQWEN